MKKAGRPFMAELQRARRGAQSPHAAPGGDAAAAEPTSPPPATDTAALTAQAVESERRVLQAIGDLGSKLDRFLNTDQIEIEKIQVEIAEISGKIKATKREMANLRHPLAGEDRFQQASEELQSVVRHTESATNQIMGAVEEIDEVIQELRASLPAYQAGRVHDLQDAIARIYEACNFQDLTGQRINKVVKTLAFIEGRVETMMGLWHRAEFETMPLPADLTKVDAGLMLTGPANQPDETHISQSDIDALFG